MWQEVWVLMDHSLLPEGRDLCHLCDRDGRGQLQSYLCASESWRCAGPKGMEGCSQSPSQQMMFFLKKKQMKKFNLPKMMMVHFCTVIIESILTSSITVWYAAATVKDESRLQRIIRSDALLICKLCYECVSVPVHAQMCSPLLPLMTNLVSFSLFWFDGSLHIYDFQTYWTEACCEE